MTADVRSGDTVRVVLQGKAGEVSVEGFDVFTSAREFGNSIDLADDHVVSVEVVKRAAPQVGDTVRGSAYDALPAGTVVDPARAVGIGGRLFRTTTGWTSADGHSYSSDDFISPRTIVYLPPED